MQRLHHGDQYWFHIVSIYQSDPIVRNMILIDQVIRVIRWMDLAWRPRGAIKRIPFATKKKPRKMTNTGCFAIIKIFSSQNFIYILYFFLVWREIWIMIINENWILITKWIFWYHLRQNIPISYISWHEVFYETSHRFACCFHETDPYFV